MPSRLIIRAGEAACLRLIAPVGRFPIPLSVLYRSNTGSVKGSVRGAATARLRHPPRLEMTRWRSRCSPLPGPVHDARDARTPASVGCWRGQAGGTRIRATACQRSAMPRITPVLSRASTCGRSNLSPERGILATGRWRLLPRLLPRGPPRRRGPRPRNAESRPSERLSCMRWRGLEPPRPKRVTRPSTLRVYQFRHQRALATTQSRAETRARSRSR